VYITLKASREGSELEESIEALTGLGLTLLQSKVFSALARSGYATINEISEISKVPRQDIYRVVSELEQLGVVEKTISRPVKFSIIDIEAAFSILIDRKKEEYLKVERIKQDLLKRLIIQKQTALDQKDIDKFVLLQGRNALSRATIENLKKTTKTFDFATTQARLLQALQNMHQVFEEKLEEDVVSRIIIEKPADQKVFSYNGGKILNHPNFMLRYSQRPLNALVAIYDKKAALAPIHEDGTWLKDPSVYTTNHVFLAMFQGYFNKEWESAGRKIKKRKEESAQSLIY
jgi:sugar-specific transcriptional regulator TrmB